MCVLLLSRDVDRTWNGSLNKKLLELFFEKKTLYGLLQFK